MQHGCRGRRASLKPTKTNDRSEPVLEKWVHIDLKTKPARKSVVEELKAKKDTIEAMHQYNEHHTKEAIEKLTGADAVASVAFIADSVLTVTSMG